MELYEYGILTEQSDIRAHVSVACRSVFVFQTQKAIHALNNGEYRIVSAYQPGCNEPTAKGWIVPPNDIDDLRHLNCGNWSGWSEFTHSMTTSQKGNHAVELVLELMRLGHFPIWLENQKETRDTEIQIKGADIVVHMNKKVQIKCDWKAGPKAEGGSGNLFLQKSERNPHKYT